VSEDWPAAWLRDRLAYEAGEASLFAAALTHRSAGSGHNERLEFLGDAVLNLVVAELLYRRHPKVSEGDLSRLRARVVSAEPLAEVSAALGLGDVLRMGSGELKSGGFRRKSILADALEALFGAVFLDRGLDAVHALIEKLFAARIEALPPLDELKDAKTRLQEHLQSRGLPLPRYSVDRIEGEPHAQTFRVTCTVKGLGLRAQGDGSSRRRAEQVAAERALEAILEQGASPGGQET